LRLKVSRAERARDPGVRRKTAPNGESRDEGIMERWLGPWSDYCYAVLRIVAGLAYLIHGTQKMFGFPGGHAVVGNHLLQTAAGIELIAGTLIALGFYTSYAAFLASGEMASAYFMVHIWNGFWPIVNRGELPVLYCFLFLFIASRGAGLLSLDRVRS
jgi:putative oxidoreductase